MISKNTIDAVYEISRVEEVISDFVQLKKSGSNYKGLSPFSNEKSPSFMVSPVKQIWKDFSSGKGGNVIAFLMEHEHFTYPDAIKYLARKYNIEIEETQQTDEEKKRASEKESLYLVSDFAKKYFQEQLHQTDIGKAIGLSYFKERGFHPETIQKFELGYSPDSWDAFTNEALQKQYNIKHLEKTGLTIVKDDKKFDRFKGRVIFPITSLSGRVLGFGGRILKNNTKAAKYLNSPESEIYNKSKVLYGIYQAKQRIAQKDKCYLVEGYTDVIQFHQTGVTNTVSSSGTALTTDQIRLIGRLTKNITLLFDADPAGMRAALRGVDLILEQGINVRVCTFPEGEDPDSFAKSRSEEAVNAYLDSNEQDFIQFKSKILYADTANDPIKKAETLRSIVSSIAKIPDAIKQEIYIRQTASQLGVSEQVLFSGLAQQQVRNQKEAVKKGGRETVLRKVTDASELSAATSEKTSTVSENPNIQNRGGVSYSELHVLEATIIGILILYGNTTCSFTEHIYEQDANAQWVTNTHTYECKVSKKIFLDLQDDEVAFTNPDFQKIYDLLIKALLNEDSDFKIDQFLKRLPPEISHKVMQIQVLVQVDKYELHDWERKEIYVKPREQLIENYVRQMILNLRRILVISKIESLSKANFSTSMAKDATTNQEGEEGTVSDSVESIAHKDAILKEIMDYYKLRKMIYEQLGRVV